MATQRKQSSLEAFSAGVVGVYEDIPEDAYHAHAAISNSGLSRINKSLAHFRYGGSSPSTDAQVFGRAFHAMCEDPKTFSDRYTVFNGDRRSSAGKEAYARAVEQYGENIIKAADYEAIFAMRRSMLSKDVTRRLVEMQGQNELSLLWDGLGPLAKSRFDKYVGPAGLIIDFKTTRDASPKAFSRAIYQFGYHRQAAFYLEAARSLGMPAERFIILAVEKTPPYACAAYELQDEALSAGMGEILTLMDAYKTALETDTWPDYPDEITMVNLPAWAYSEEYEDE